jgi:hypothetical protein
MLTGNYDTFKVKGMSVQISRRCFNVTEYYRMAEAGILSEDDRVELIEGEVIGNGRDIHTACKRRLPSI